MANNGNMSKSFFGGIPIIVYDDSATYFGDMNRSFFGGVPIIVGPALSVGTKMQIKVDGLWKLSSVQKIKVSGEWKSVLAAKIKVSGAWISI